MPITATMKAPATRAVRQATTRQGTLFAADRYWAAAFAAPYIAVFLVFVIYPIGYGLWLGSAGIAQGNMNANSNILNHQPLRAKNPESAIAAASFRFTPNRR